MFARTTNIICILSLTIFAFVYTHSADADPPVLFPANTDLDLNGAFETEYSSISQTFLAPGSGGRISFDWQLFSSEFVGGGAEDVFYVRLLDAATGNIIDEVNGALDPTPAGYMGSFTPIGAPPMGTTGSSEAPAGGNGLMFDAFHLDGGTGWTTDFLSIAPAASDYLVTLEFLVADAVDGNADTSLAIDDIEARSATGGPIATLVNPSFETMLNGWIVAGNAGNYAQLEDLFVGGPEPGTSATDGELFGMVSTAGVPEPSGVFMLLLGAWIVAAARKRLN